MKYADKYKPMYFPAPAGYNKWMEKDHIEQPPIWCSVDLRDGNQALIIPMSLEEKIELLYNNRDVLKRMSLKSLEIANNSPFDEITISQQWNDLLSHIKHRNNNK